MLLSLRPLPYASFSSFSALFLPPIHVPVTLIPLVHPSSKTSSREGEEGMKERRQGDAGKRGGLEEKGRESEWGSEEE